MLYKEWNIPILKTDLWLCDVLNKMLESHSSRTTEDGNVKVLQNVGMYLHTNLYGIIYQMLVCIYKLIYKATYPPSPKKSQNDGMYHFKFCIINLSQFKETVNCTEKLYIPHHCIYLTLNHTMSVMPKVLEIFRIKYVFTL
jgi:hypothetical protein